MKNKLIRRFLMILSALLIAMGFSIFLNRASFDPNFSVIDAISSATKRSHKSSSNSNTAATWGYSAENIALPDMTAYCEGTIAVENGSSYVVLKKENLPKNTLVMLSDKDNDDYRQAVQQVTAYYRALGYRIEIRECSETMMLSLAHAEHFDLFLLREEAE